MIRSFISFVLVVLFCFLGRNNSSGFIFDEGGACFGNCGFSSLNAEGTIFRESRLAYYC